MHVDRLIDVLVAELERDAKLEKGDPLRRSLRQREDLIAKITRLQMSKGKKNKEYANKGQSRVKLGRPRRDLNPESPGRSFLKKVGEVISDEEGSEVDSPREGATEVRVEAGPGHESRTQKEF